jgi:NADPH2:quinone reductase
MKAMLLHEYGETARFHEEDIPQPRTKPGHVLIRVKAASFNPVDYKIRTLGPDFGPELPAVLHGDVAGIVEEVGQGVTAFKPGDKVYGCAGGVRGTGGALAEYMLADADLLAPMPANLGFAESAALPLVSLTAWQGLHDMASVVQGAHVLVHGATGGVGHVAVQVAKNLGARVAGTVGSADKAELARSLGVEEVIDYKQEPVEEYVRRLTNGQGFDVVMDTVGGKNLEACFPATKLYGHVVTTVARGVHDLSLAHARGLTIHCVFMLLPLVTGQGRDHYGQVLRRLAAWAEDGSLRPLLDGRRFAITEANEAHEYWAGGKHKGKIVLEWR